jgi:nucleoside-diphosphate-sugar epimerase
MSPVPNPPRPTRVLITGGSRGIGLEVARDLAASGHRLWLAAKQLRNSVPPTAPPESTWPTPTLSLLSSPK